jgi:enhancer of polycomb-like protein
MTLTSGKRVATYEGFPSHTLASRYLQHTMTYVNEHDQQQLSTDVSIPVTVDNRQQFVVPFKLGQNPNFGKTFLSSIPRNIPPAPAPQVNIAAPQAAMPISMQQQLRKMPPPNGIPSMRISSNGGIRPSSASASPAPGAQASQASPPSSATAAQHTSPATNGINRAAINIAHVEVPKPDMTPSAVSSLVTQSSDPQQTQEPKVNGINGVNGSPQKPQTQALPPNAATTTAYPQQIGSYQVQANALNNAHFAAAYNAQQQAMVQQQLMQFKSHFANMQNSQDLANLQAVARNLPASYLQQLPGGNNFNMQNFAQLQAAAMNLKLPANRQWPAPVGTPTKPAGVPMVNGAENAASNPIQSGVPGRAPSANGTRANGIRISSNGSAHGMSPHVQHSPSPVPAAAVGQSQSPPRLPVTPTLTKASPAIQHAQPGASKSGY